MENRLKIMTRELSSELRHVRRMPVCLPPPYFKCYKFGVSFFQTMLCPKFCCVPNSTVSQMWHQTFWFPNIQNNVSTLGHCDTQNGNLHHSSVSTSTHPCVCLEIGTEPQHSRGVTAKICQLNDNPIEIQHLQIWPHWQAQVYKKRRTPNTPHTSLFRNPNLLSTNFRLQPLQIIDLGKVSLSFTTHCSLYGPIQQYYKK